MPRLRVALVSSLAVLGCLVSTGASASTPATPIPSDPLPQSSPAFVGSVATPHPVSAQRPPQNPFMAPDPGGNIHADAYMTDSYPGPGPLGRKPTSTSTLQAAECASLTFDRQGRLETVCVSTNTVTLKLFDPDTLAELASYSLPPRRPGGGTFNDFSGGGYFYLDNHDRAVIPTTTNHIYIVRQTAAPGFVLQRDYDLTPAIGTDDKIESVLPDWSGRLVFVSDAGVVGAIDQSSGAVHTIDLGEKITNSLATDETGGVYVVTDKALYRVDVNGAGRPHTTWRQAYRNTGQQKPGQTQAGSGTTPTLMGKKWVAITDNADPMDVVVYRRGASVAGSRLVCRQPVFDKGASATDNSLITAGRALVVTNNYGYANPTATMEGGVTTPGIARVDVNRDGSGCHTVWTNRTERSPSSVAKLSLADGLVYTVLKDPAGTQDPWYLGALDFRTGKLVFKTRYGSGFGYNVNYAPVTLGPDGVAYVGVLGGLVRIADSP